MPLHAYRLEVSSLSGKEWSLYLSPSTKKVVLLAPKFYNFDTPSSGVDLEGNSVSFFSNAIAGGEYELRDGSFPEGSSSSFYDADNGTCQSASFAPKNTVSTSASSGWNAAALVRYRT